MFLSGLRSSFFLALIAALTLNHLNAQGFLHTEGKRIVNGKGENVLLRGIGLGGWMLQEGYMLRLNGQGQQNKIRSRIAELIGEANTEQFYNAWLSNHTRKIDIDSMKAWGFNSVRLPMHFNLYTLPIDKEPVPRGNTWIDKGFRITDSLLAWCKANQIYLVLDLHAAPGGQGNDLNISDRDASKPSLWESEENQKKTIALWKKLAQRYANEPWIGGYDILNEPNWGFEDLTNDKNGLKEKKNEPLRKLMVDITKAIREVDKRHIIIIEGNGWGNNYNGILPTWDDNMVLSFHKYWNYNNPASIQHILNTRDQYNVPVWLGETGENSNVWFTEAIYLLESNNIGWAWWPLKKMGNNNPMQILSNPNYDKILAYWSGRGPKPTAEEAFDGVMKLASSAKLENTVIKKDVIDAMFRQPFSAEAIPFKLNLINKTAILNAVDYDLGKNGIAYFDNDTADYHVSTGKRGSSNRGGFYRNDGVDIKADSVKTNTFYITNFEKAEWLQYTLNVAKDGIYNLKLSCVSKNQEGKLSLSLNNNAPTLVDVKESNDWQTIVVKQIRLVKGDNKLRLNVNDGNFDVKTIELVKAKP
ncbi:MAG TPA: cellulase family glycosylhydrolase [Flavisolibacter sp.]|jgi:aryl-phospho-beta-D-glucosidase BglC (GH1 family)|nr:cellulase family glycosylhydrolase [Flavisolibacter sp.]